jgi:hypothetical protein
MRRAANLLWACLAILLGTLFVCSAAAQQETWYFDQLNSLGGRQTRVLGHPRLIDSELGKAVAFNGVDDALFVQVHPLAGANTWTWEMIFKPDADGKPEQRIFHLQSVDPATGDDIRDERMLFEIRIRGDKWCLDSFAISQGQQLTLLNCEKLHPFGRWYRVSAVYDGKIFHNYVDNELQGEGPLMLEPEGPGRSSVGTRIDLRDYYKGSIYKARFTRRALEVKDFLPLPHQRTASPPGDGGP